MKIVKSWNQIVKKAFALKTILFEISATVLLLVATLLVLSYFRVIDIPSFLPFKFYSTQSSININNAYTTLLRIEDLKLLSRVIFSGKVKHAILDMEYRGVIKELSGVKNNQNQYKLRIKVGDNLIPLKLSKNAPSVIQDSISGEIKIIKMDDLGVGDLIEIEYKVDLLNKNIIKEYKIIRLPSNIQ